jgi:hypothetical protein
VTRAIEFYCRNGHPPATMRPIPMLHAIRCPVCGNVNSQAFLFRRYAWAWKLARRD